MSRVFSRALIAALVALVMLPAIAGEGRTPIYQWQTTITQPGKYIVTRHIQPLICAAAVIDIRATDVDIDLNGFTLWACPGHPVITATGQDNITIRNGTLKFADYGIFIVGGDQRNRKVVIEDVKVLDVIIGGIVLDGISDFALRRNNVTTTDFFGFGPTQEGILVDGRPGVDPPVPVKGTIEDNQVERTGGGITVRGGSGVAILNNRVEDIQVVAPPPAQGGIVYDLSDDGLIANNTVENIREFVSGIYLGDASGCKVYNNTVRSAERHGIHVAGFSNDNLILDNVVTLSGEDGLRVEGFRNHVDRNVLNSNCQSGASCWGLHFVAALGGADSTYGRNTARGNLGNPQTCPWPGAPALPPTQDFCDEQLPGPSGTGCTSFGDNFMPFLF